MPPQILLEEAQVFVSGEVQTDVVVTGEQSIVVITPAPEEPVVVTVGLQGPSGPSSHFEQAFVNQAVVTVNHNLGHKPAVTVIDSAGDEIECDVQHLSANQAALSFSASFTGTALFN